MLLRCCDAKQNSKYMNIKKRDIDDDAAFSDDHSVLRGRLLHPHKTRRDNSLWRLGERVCRRPLIASLSYLEPHPQTPPTPGSLPLPTHSPVPPTEAQHTTVFMNEKQVLFPIVTERDDRRLSTAYPDKTSLPSQTAKLVPPRIPVGSVRLSFTVIVG